MPDDETTDDVPGADGGSVTAVPSDEVAAALLERFEGAVFHESHGQPVVHLDRAHWLDAARFLREEQEFTQCVLVTCVDHLIDLGRLDVPGVEAERFEIVAGFLSHERNRRIRLVAQLPATDPTVASLCPVFPGVNFAEREVYDLYGVTFTDHPDPTRILMPEDWEGHPLRKDYPPAHVPVTFKGDPTPR